MLHKKRKPSTFTNNGNTKVSAVNNMLHSKSAYFYRWSSVVPSVCGVALLTGLYLSFNPIDNNTNKAHAETVTANPTSYSSISMTISNNTSRGLSSGDTVTTNVEPGLVNYIDNNIKISTSRIDRFYVTVQAAENGTSELTGIAHGETIAPVGKDITADNFGDNTWGYALGDTSVSSSSFAYNSLPTYNTAITPQYASAQNLQDGEYNLKLTFAAKINADKPSDHYTTKAMVSVAADAGELPLITGVTTMQDFAKYNACNRIDEAGMQLVDDRTASGLGKTTYWVTKLKDGKCWMTQNLDLALTTGAELSSADTDILDVSGKYTVPTDLGNYNDPGMINFKTTAASAAYAGSNCGDPSASGCANYFEAYTKSDVSGDEKAHYLIGNYYPWTITMAGKTTENSGSICPKGWKLPTISEYGAITALGNNITGSNAVRLSPYYFAPVGFHSSSYSYVANQGYYWSSTPNGGDSAYVLTFYSGLLSMGLSARTYGLSVRCILK